MYKRQVVFRLVEFVRLVCAFFCSILFDFLCVFVLLGALSYQFSVVEFVSIFACHCARVSYLEEFGTVRPPSLK